MAESSNSTREALQLAAILDLLLADCHKSYTDEDLYRSQNTTGIGPVIPPCLENINKQKSWNTIVTHCMFKLKDLLLFKGRSRLKLVMPTHHPLYKAVWYWKDNLLLCHLLNEEKERLNKQQIIVQEPIGTKNIHFLENVDQNLQKVYKQKYQRTIKPNVPNVVTLQDIKDVTTYLMLGSIPEAVLSVIHSSEINNFFRSLIVYFQLYLQVWDDLLYRRMSYTKQRLKHPISIIRETLCKTTLSKLRCRIGQEYALLIAGENNFMKHHHMNNTLYRSYTTKDIEFYEYFFKFSARIVWVALYRTNYKEIEMELSRLFHSRNIEEERKITAKETFETDCDRNVLYGDTLQFTSHWSMLSPAISDIFVNKDKPDVLLAYNVYSPQFDGTKISGLEAALTLPEELLERFKLTVGILGQPRDNFEIMLHIKQGPVKSLEEQELEKALTNVEQDFEKPSIKMYQYLNELDNVIDLSARTTSGEEMDDIKKEIELYLSNHIEDSKRAFRMWNRYKGFRS